MRRRGELSFEGILGLAFLAVLLTTIMAVYQFHVAQSPRQVETTNVVSSYNLVLESLGEDTKYADSMQMTPEGVDLIEKNRIFAKYRFMNGNLYRIDASDRGSILIGKLDKAIFRTHPELKKLLMVTLLPQDKMQIPFFTSFALRGSEN
ncbi:MAG: hypothetical protein Kow0029_13910 [Candidatus Rifleibacteriota bacterium]